MNTVENIIMGEGLIFDCTLTLPNIRSMNIPSQGYMTPFLLLARHKDQHLIFETFLTLKLVANQ